jgi:hypothetical protein
MQDLAFEISSQSLNLQWFFELRTDKRGRPAFGLLPADCASQAFRQSEARASSRIKLPEKAP